MQRRLFKKNLGRFPGSEIIMYPLAIGIAIYAAFQVGSSFINWAEAKSKKPSMYETNQAIVVKASPDLAGYFPTKGFDYDKDGKIDEVKKFVHGAPRIPFGSWHTEERDSFLFKKVQEEYEKLKRK